jgi:hypothetical protein
MSNNSKQPFIRRTASQSHQVRITPPPVVPGRARSSQDDMYGRLTSRRVSPEEEWASRQNTGKVPGDLMDIRCSGCQHPVRRGLFSKSRRYGCSLTPSEEEEEATKPESERLFRELYTNCGGKSTRFPFYLMRLTRAEQGVGTLDLWAPPKPREMDPSVWASFHKEDCNLE